ncbi:MAG: nucleotidyltransferase domain-containing protein [Candidatus Latescibacteria bacterium]|nr:nucleotidyltransferase domain-containing protein [Candidatus Latescibacterota bacterium]
MMRTYSLKQLAETEKERILNLLGEALQRRPEVRFAYLFGSFVESDHFHDIDVAVYLEEGTGAMEDRWYDIRLSGELEKRGGYPIDIVILNRAPDHLVHRISKGYLLFSRDEEFRVEFITTAWKRYLDFKPKRMAYLEEIMS